MTRAAQPSPSVEGQQALDQYTSMLKRVEALSPMAIRNNLSDLRQFIAWREDGWCEEQDEPSFTPQAVLPSLLIRYRTYLQTTLRVLGKGKKVREILLNATARFILLRYLETLPQGTTYLFLSEKTRGALTERALGHLIAKYAQLAQVLEVSSHDPPSLWLPHGRSGSLTSAGPDYGA
jgi:hypothetical protein